MLLVRQGFRRDGRQRVTWLVFEQDARRPFVVARHYASPAWNGALAEEYDHLNGLARSTCGSLVPEPLATTTIESRVVLFERASPGLPLPRGWDEVRRTDLRRAPALLEEHFALAATVIGRLDATARPAPTGSVQEAVGRLERRLAELAEHHQLELDLPAASEAFSRASQVLANASASHLRTVHGDFVPANLLQWPHGVHLIDWEYRIDSSPLWTFEALKFTYFELWEVCRRELLDLPSDLTSAFRLFIGGRAGVFQDHAERFFVSLGLPCQHEESRTALWALFFLVEIVLMAEVADPVYTRPLAEQLGWLVNPTARRLVAAEVGAGASGGTAAAPAEHVDSTTSAEIARLTADRERLACQHADAVGECDALRSELAEARSRLTTLAAERDASRMELERFQQSRLWRLGTLYWKLRELIGSVPLFRALLGRKRN